MTVQLAKRRGSTTSRCWCRTCWYPRRSPRSWSPPRRVQGFLAAGHVCTVMGLSQYQPLVDAYRVPIVVTGFEPLDVLEGIRRTLTQLEQGRAGWTTPTRGRCPRRGQRGGARGRGGRLRDLRPSMARDRDDPAVRMAVVTSLLGIRRRTTLRRRGYPPRSPASAAQVRFCRDSSSPTSARPSARSAHLGCRWERRWCRPRVPVPPTTSSVDSTLRPCHDRAAGSGELVMPTPIARSAQCGDGSRWGGRLSRS